MNPDIIFSSGGGGFRVAEKNISDIANANDIANDIANANSKCK